MILDLLKTIQVRTGDYRRKWADAKIVSVQLEKVAEDEDGKAVEGLSFSVEFLGESGSQHVHDAFGWNAGNWRYKETGCSHCKWQEREGGDAVPYGSTTVNLPEYQYCVCPNVSDEEIENKCENTAFGKTCEHFESKE